MYVGVASASSMPPPPPLAAFCRLWGCQLLIRAASVLALPSTALAWTTAALALLVVALPTRPAVLGLAFGVRSWQIWVQMPYVYDSQYWALQWDLAFLAPLLCVALAEGASPLRALSASAARTVVAGARPTILWQLALFYLASGFFKINSSFLDPSVSCAVVYFCDLLGVYVPEVLVTPAVLRFVALAAPTLTVGVELLLGALAVPLLPHRVHRVGLALLLLFHLAIALTPHPNDIATFGLSNAPRFFFLLPDASATAFAELTGQRLTLAAAAAAAAAVCTALNTRPGVLDINVGFYAVAVVLFGRAVLLDGAELPLRSSNSAAKEEQIMELPMHCALLLRVAQTALVALAFLYAFVALPLGAMEQGTPNMFAGLRAYSGSNHLLLPTGMLQRAHLEDSLSDYGGGVVRVDFTNSTYLLATLQYPGEMTQRHPPQATEYMRRIGHTGQHFYPSHLRTDPASIAADYTGGGAAVGYPFHSHDGQNTQASDGGGGEEDSDGRDGFLRYTLTAFELRRLLAEMRVRNELAFELVYTRLPGAEGDEAWRRGPGRRVVLVETWRDGRREQSCNSQTTAAVAAVVDHAEGDVSSGRLSACAKDELALLPPVAETRGWASRFLLSHPYPIIGRDTQQACLSP
jgi:hypothetical protein